MTISSVNANRELAKFEAVVNHLNNDIGNVEVYLQAKQTQKSIQKLYQKLIADKGSPFYKSYDQIAVRFQEIQTDRKTLLKMGELPNTGADPQLIEDDSCWCICQ